MCWVSWDPMVIVSQRRTGQVALAGWWRRTRDVMPTIAPLQDDRPKFLDSSTNPGCVPTIVQATSREANKDIPETSGNPRSCSDKALIHVNGLQPLRATLGEVASTTNIVNDDNKTRHRSDFLSGAHDQFESCDLEDEDDDWDPIKGNKTPEKTYLLSGPEELQAKTKLLIEEYKDIFCDKLNKVPAKLQPMTLTVDDAKWDSKRNRLPFLTLFWHNTEWCCTTL